MKYIYDAFNDSTSIYNDLTPKNSLYYYNDSYILNEFIFNDDKKMKSELESLINDHPIVKKLDKMVLYDDFDRHYETYYNMFVMNGYLKINRVINEINDIYELKIPNKDIKQIINIINNQCFKRYIREKAKYLMDCFLKEDVYKAIRRFIDFLYYLIIDSESPFVSYYIFLKDLFEDDDTEMSFGKINDDVSIIISIKGHERAVILDCLISNSADDLIDDSFRAIKHISDNHYKDDIKAKTQKDVLAYGISLYKHKCFISKL